MYTDIDVRVCSQITGREIHIQIEPNCFRSRFSLMNGVNRNCVDHDITCGRTIINISLSELYPTTPPMCDQSSDPPDDPPDDPTSCSSTQCQPCPTHSEMEYTTTTDAPTSTTDHPTGQCPNVTTSNEPKSNTSSSQASKVNNKRDSLIISLGVLVGILVILLVVVTSGWVWTCWTMKRNKATTPEHVRYKKDNYC